MRMMQILGGLAVLAAAGHAMAASPDAGTIMERMERVLEPPRSSLRKITLAVTQEGSRVEVKLGGARDKRDGANHVLVVVLAPADLSGTAFLVKEEVNGPNDTTWVYIPAIGRVRRLVSPEAYSAFLNSDFAYSDLGFVDTDATVTLKGEKTLDGVRVYVLRAVPRASWYYSAIETAVDADSYLPVERRYFDAAGALWKVERWAGISTIDGIPTALKVSMEDVQAKTSSTLTVTHLEYGVQGLEKLLQPTGLPEAARSPLWALLDDSVIDKSD